MKRKELYALNQAFGTVKFLKGVKFSYAIAKNKRKIEADIELLREAIKPSDRMKEFDEKRIELAKTHSKKDGRGEPQKITTLAGQEEFVIEDMDAFTKEVEALKELYKDAVEEQDAKIAEANKMMEEEISIELEKIGQEDIPEDIMAEQLDSIFLMIKD